MSNTLSKFKNDLSCENVKINKKTNKTKPKDCEKSITVKKTENEKNIEKILSSPFSINKIKEEVKQYILQISR